MLAAAALAPHVDGVTVVERDTLPDGPVPRTGLPQSRHAHILLPSGRDAVEALVPGGRIRERLAAAGAREASLTSLLTFGGEGWFRRWGRDDHLLTVCSRDLLDWTVREAVLDTPGLVVRAGRAVALLGAAPRVTGVRVRDADGREEDLAADLVVDASGRGSRAPHWLAELGVTGVTESVVDSGLVYASRRYRIPEGAEDWPLTQVTADPSSGEPGRSANLVPIEDNQWLVSLGGTRGAEPTGDADDFAPFARGLRHPLVGDLIAGAEPLTDVVLTRSTRNGRRHFETAAAWPDGFVVLGDAVATYNPVYGQGMSVAALGARALQDALRAWTGRAGVRPAGPEGVREARRGRLGDEHLAGPLVPRRRGDPAHVRRQAPDPVRAAHDTGGDHVAPGVLGDVRGDHPAEGRDRTGPPLAAAGHARRSGAAAPRGAAPHTEGARVPDVAHVGQAMTW